MPKRSAIIIYTLHQAERGNKMKKMIATFTAILTAFSLALPITANAQQTQSILSSLGRYVAWAGAGNQGGASAAVATVA